MDKRCAKALKKGEQFLKKSKEKIGVTPLPWEPGGEKFYSL